MPWITGIASIKIQEFDGRMNEREIKRMVESLRNEIEKRKKRINSLLAEIRIHKREAERIRTNRDKAVKEFKELIEKRREINAEIRNISERISRLRNERNSLLNRKKSMLEKIRSLKVERDCLNRKARGSYDHLMNILRNKVDEICNIEMPLEKEIKMFDRILDIRERIITAVKADKKHDEISNIYQEIKEINEKISKINKEMQFNSEEIKILRNNISEFNRKIDDKKREADEFHRKLLEKYDIINPIKGEIDEIKGEIDEIRERLDPLNEKLREIKRKRDDEKNRMMAMKIREKLKKSKRISIYDLRLLIEKEMLK
ncbi:MAG TPA: hypothetical protein ENF49_01960 [Candidatus Altiarchaeales archaeon]|nr:hypothetical protein [Candidatus Altiarchaeales archaeon]HEX54872.1 hypothetical protein [Candidatus Altiarchaeales archaeon]